MSLESSPPCFFLTRSQNKGMAEVIGTKVINWIRTYVYRLYGLRPYIERLKAAVEKGEK